MLMYNVKTSRAVSRIHNGGRATTASIAAAKAKKLKKLKPRYLV